MARTISELNISRPKPTIRLDAKDLPAIKNWQVGKRYCLHVDATLESLSKGDEWDNVKRPMEARFTIKSVKETEDGKDYS